MRNRAVTIAGVAVVEFALIISVLALLTLAVVDISRAIQAQIILISISREGASLAARSSGLQMQQIMDALGDSATPGASLTRGLLGPFNANGMIYITEVMGYQDTPTSAVRNVVTAKYRWLGGGGYAPSSVVWNCGSWSGDGSCNVPSSRPTANVMTGQLRAGELIYAVEAFYRFDMFFAPATPAVRPVDAAGGPGPPGDDGALNETRAGGMMRTPTFRRIRGQIAVLTAVVMVVVIGAVGLAIDSGLGYIIRARLNSAVDAAGIAAARDVVIGTTRSEQEASARQAAREFFDANYPASGFFHSTPTLGNVDITWLPNGRVLVNVAATSVVPVTLMHLFDFEFLNVGSAAEVLRKDLDMSFVMDTTDSMAPVVGTVRSSAKSFLDHFNPTVDRIALIHFSHGAVVDVPFKADQSRGFDRATMKTRITNYSFNGFTNYSEGLLARARPVEQQDLDGQPLEPARDRVLLRRLAEHLRVVLRVPRRPSQLRAVQGASHRTTCRRAADRAVAHVDGLWCFDDRQFPASATSGEGRSAGTSIATLPHDDGPAELVQRARRQRPRVPCRHRHAARRDHRDELTTVAYRNINRASRNLPEAMANAARNEGIYIYTLGLGSHVHDLTGPDNENGESLLKRMANTADSATYNASQPTGVYCWAATENDLMPCFAKLASEIMRITK